MAGTVDFTFFWLDDEFAAPRRTTYHGRLDFLFPLRNHQLFMTRSQRLVQGVCFLFATVLWAAAQPGPFLTLRNSNLVFNASTLLTNGLTGLTGPLRGVIDFISKDLTSMQPRLPVAAMIDKCTVWS
jgi:hypothetical protein